MEAIGNIFHIFRLWELR